MSTIAVTSVRSSPGATSLGVALGAIFASEVGLSLIIEADPTGGVLGLRFDLPSEPSWATLSADLRRHGDRSMILQNTVELQGARCLAAPADPMVTFTALRRSAGSVAERLAAVNVPTVIDIGRTVRDSPALPLAAGADEVLVVCRPRVDEIQSVLFTVRLLHSAGCRVGLVTIGDRPHHPAEVAELAGVRLAGVLPDDPAMAVAFSGGRYNARRLGRSTLWRSVLSLGSSLLDVQPSAATAPTQLADTRGTIETASASQWPPPREVDLVADSKSRRRETPNSQPEPPTLPNIAPLRPTSRASSASPLSPLLQGTPGAPMSPAVRS